jgi:hypothetical protein
MFFLYFIFLNESYRVSEYNSSIFHTKRSFTVWIAVPADEILEDDFGVLKVRGMVIIGLTVDSEQCLLIVLEPPDVALDVYS